MHSSIKLVQPLKVVATVSTRKFVISANSTVAKEPHLSWYSSGIDSSFQASVDWQIPVPNSALNHFGCLGLFQQKLPNVQSSQHFNNPHSAVLQQQPGYEIKALGTLISPYIIITTFAKDLSLSQAVNSCLLCRCAFCCASLCSWAVPGTQHQSRINRRSQHSRPQSYYRNCRLHPISNPSAHLKAPTL